MNLKKCEDEMAKSVGGLAVQGLMEDLKNGCRTGEIRKGNGVGGTR